MSEKKLTDLEIAVRNKYRYEQPGYGLVSTEDLFDLPLEKPNTKSQRVVPNLEDIAIELDKKQQTSTKSFVKKKTVTDNVSARKLRIVCRVIEIKQDDIEAKEQAAIKASEKARLLALYDQAKFNEDCKKSPEEIKAMIDNI